MKGTDLTMKRVTKQILAALLIVISILQMSVITYAETGEAADNDIVLLKNLGFVDDKFGPKSGKDLVNRSQFASMLAYLRGFDGSYVNDSRKFVDISADYWCAGQIYALNEAGLIHGTSEDMFSPNDYITYPQVIKCLVSLLGYDVQAEQLGGYPNGYLSAASQIGLVGNNKAGAVDFSTVAKLIVKAMDTELLEQTLSVGGEITYSKSKYQTPLKKYNDIYHDTGIMTDNGITTLTGNTRVGAKSVIINNTTIDKGDCDVEEYLGYRLKYYYKNDGNDNMTLIFAVPYSTNVIKLTDDMVDIEHPQFSKKRIYYVSDRGNSFYKIDDYADVIYNGKAYPAFDDDTLKITQGSLTLIDNDGDGDYDIINVDAYRSLYVSSIDTDNEKIYDKYGSFVEYGKFNTVKFYTSDGSPATIKAVSKKQVLSVFESLDNSLVKIIISTEGITGRVDTIKNIATKTSSMTPAQIATFKKDARETRIVIGEEEFALSSEFINAVASGYQGASIPTSGLTYIFHLDNNRKIAGIEDPTGKQYAYLISMKYVTHGEMSGLTKVKVFMQDSSIINTVFAKNVRIDGTKLSGHSDGADGVCSYSGFYKTNGDFKRQPIKVRLNNLGEITEIETAKDLKSLSTAGLGYNPKNEFTRCDSNSDTDSSITVGWGGTQTHRFEPYTLANDAIIFNIPPDSEFDEDELGIISVNSLVESTKYPVKLYDSDASWACKFAVIQAGASTDWLLAPCLVASIGVEVIDEDGTVAKVVRGLENTKMVKYVENKPGIFPSALAVGDIVRVVKGVGDKVTNMEILVSPTKDAPFSIKDIGGNDQWSTYYGQLYAVSDTGFTLTLNGGSTLIGIPFHTDFGIYNVFDVKSKTVRRGTRSDMVMNYPIKEDGSIDLPKWNDLSDGDSMIYVYVCRGYARGIVIVKF